MGNCLAIGGIYRLKSGKPIISFTFGKNNNIITLDELYTHGLEWIDDEIAHEQRFRLINGEKIRITENEYIRLLKNYGSAGYNPEEELKQRVINLDFKPLSEYGK